MLEEFGIEAKMPALMSKGQKQLGTDEANESRLVTKIRWLVESANARIKRFKYLDHIIPNSQIPFIGDYVRIVCAISNKYFPPISDPRDVVMAAKMKTLREKENELQKMIEENGLDRKRTVWRNVEEVEITFPKMNVEQLCELTLGVYQLNQSSSYIQEYIDGDFDIKVNIDDESLLCVRMQSRHISRKSYLLWVKVEGEVVDGWYCNCRCGSRVIGMCSHVAAIIWYLSYARHISKDTYGVRNWGVHLSDAAVYEVDETSGSETE